MDITSVYVRRRRTPTLGFWVALALIVPAVAALLVSPLFDFADIAGVLNFMLVAAVFVGLPLAAIACVIDAIRHRTPKGPRRGPPSSQLSGRPGAERPGAGPRRMDGATPPEAPVALWSSGTWRRTTLP